MIWRVVGSGNPYLHPYPAMPSKIAPLVQAEESIGGVQNEY